MHGRPATAVQGLNLPSHFIAHTAYRCGQPLAIVPDGCSRLTWKHVHAGHASLASRMHAVQPHPAPALAHAVDRTVPALWAENP